MDLQQDFLFFLQGAPIQSGKIEDRKQLPQTRSIVKLQKHWCCASGMCPLGYQNLPLIQWLASKTGKWTAMRKVVFRCFKSHDCQLYLVRQRVVWVYFTFMMQFQQEWKKRLGWSIGWSKVCMFSASYFDLKWKPWKPLYITVDVVKHQPILPWAPQPQPNQPGTRSHPQSQNPGKHNIPYLET